VPGVVVYLTFTLTYGGIITHSLLLVNRTLSSLAKSPNQCCKLSLKSPKGSGWYDIYTFTRFFFCVESGIQLKESGSHEQFESEIQDPLKKESGIHGLESRIQGTVWFPYIGRHIEKKGKSEVEDLFRNRACFDSHSYCQRFSFNLWTFDLCNPVIM